jgi:hypothetical protein
MSEYRYFDIYIAILNAIFTLYKNERFNILADEVKRDGSLINNND